MSLWLPDDKPFAPCEWPNWEPFFGSNSRLIRTGLTFGGAVSFALHIGQPLTVQLWHDLMFRLKVSYLRVYKYDQVEREGLFGRSAKVYLDEHGNVSDIHLCP